MRVILTHEQADFDAMGALLGAHLLDEHALAVLPRRVNRNVRAFLTLYGAELPFTDPRDLPNEPIEEITLVDTQSLITLKGMADTTRIRAIDHHPKRDDLPADWQVTFVDIGAATTLFVEGLRERDLPLSSLQATLLLLGIYEDTGSLTYDRTTARELMAAAYLLEQGANLNIAAGFLNHPLSAGQQEIYDALRKSATTNVINGYNLMIACGDATQVEEELSTIAHKLRDLLDPDALFLLLRTRGGVQLIARSTHADIDVDRIAEEFGGGGHDRAAAAMIKDGVLEQVCEQLISLLPRFVHPAVTVSQIMSRGPQLLVPDTRVEEAAKRMQRYGYEGYPVVDSGRLVGLLTRRAVDRALAHKLNLSAAELMEAGSFTVTPDDSLETVQRMMTETGWGQIPVVNEEGGEIIGIVTRTDLIKTLRRSQPADKPQNLAPKLENALPPARIFLLMAAAQAAVEQHAAIYIVGGFVRDLLLQRPSADFDLVVEGDAIQLARQLSHKFGGRVTTHERFGTAKWRIEDIRPQLVAALEAELAQPAETPLQGALSFAPRLKPEDLPEFLDLISARTEFYTHPTALPTVEQGSIKLDLHRRDFTINTIALRLDGRHYGELHDYWGGLNDLRQGLVRILHSLSFVDDATRMLRAVRFEQRFGFQMETRTLELLQQARPLISRVSGDRIRHELDHMLEEPQAGAMMQRLEQLGLLQDIQPGLTWDDWMTQVLQTLRDAEPAPKWGLDEEKSGSIPRKIRLTYILWQIRQPEEVVEQAIERLRIPRYLGDEILAANRLYRHLPMLSALPASKIFLQLEGISPLALYATYLSTSGQPADILQDFAFHWKKISPVTGGKELKAHGLPPGRAYSRILNTLRAAYLDGEIQNAEQERQYLEKLLLDEEITGRDRAG